MPEDKRPPRISHINRQFAATIGRLHNILDDTHNLHSSSIDQLWDIYRMLIDALDAIAKRCGDMPTDIKERISGAVTMSHDDLMQMLTKLTAQQTTQTTQQQTQSEEIVEYVERHIKRNTVQETSLKQDVTVEAEIVAEKTKSTNKSYRKQFKSEYSKILKRMKEYPYTSKTATQLINMIYQWYIRRFCTYKSDPTWKTYTYGVEQITQGIYTIVISYAKYIADGKKDDFILGFDNWLNQLNTNQKVSESQTLPYFLWDTMNNLDKQPIKPQAIILWYILFKPFWDEWSDIHEQFMPYSKDGIDIALSPNYLDEIMYFGINNGNPSDIYKLCPNGYVSNSVMYQYNVD